MGQVASLLQPGHIFIRQFEEEDAVFRGFGNLRIFLLLGLLADIRANIMDDGFKRILEILG